MNRKWAGPKWETIIAGFYLNELSRPGGNSDIAGLEHDFIYRGRNGLDGNYGVEACVFYLRAPFIPIAIGIVEHIYVRALK